MKKNVPVALLQYCKNKNKGIKHLQVAKLLITLQRKKSCEKNIPIYHHIVDCDNALPMR